jgi:hypothetical protein
MATNKPRITVTLDQEVYETIRALSSLQGVTMSGMVSDLLTMTNPVQQRVLQAIQKAQLMDAESKADMVSMLESGEAQFTEMLGPMLALMDQMAAGQPPHSNTGVTNLSDTIQGEGKGASKARSRASQLDIFDTKTQKPKNPKTQTRKSTKAPANGA